MPTIKEITTMCKAGQILEAYNIAIQDLENAPTNVWTQREVGWALYYSIKADVDSGNFDMLLGHLDKLRTLDLLTIENDGMIFENILFAISKYIKDSVSVNDQSASSKLSSIFKVLRNYQFKPSKGYSYFLQNVIKFAESWNEMVDFFDWWNLDNLTQEDYVPYVTERGNKLMTLAERAFIANSKALLIQGDHGCIEAFLPKLDALMSAHPEMIYPGYFYGKLLLALGTNEDEALRVLIPFARKKSTEFWVWQLLAEVFANAPEKQLACLLRAVNCRTQESFLPKVRMKLANIYINNQQYDKARFHIDKVTRCKVEQGQRIPYEIANIMHEPWLNMTQPNGNADLDYMAITNAILYKGTEEAIAIVTYFDPQSKRSSMIYGCQKRLTQKIRIKVNAGDALKINYINEADSRPKILNAVRMEMPNNLQFAKIVQGVIRKRDDKAFAFLKSDSKDFFIPPSAVQKYHVSDGESVSALIVYDYDKKKDSWNWVCISIKK